MENNLNNWNEKKEFNLSDKIYWYKDMINEHISVKDVKEAVKRDEENIKLLRMKKISWKVYFNRKDKIFGKDLI